MKFNEVHWTRQEHNLYVNHFAGFQTGFSFETESILFEKLKVLIGLQTLSSPQNFCGKNSTIQTFAIQKALQEAFRTALFRF